MDTIFAQATASGRSGITVIRISGPQAFDVASALVGVLPESRASALRLVRTSVGEEIDQALVLPFQAPNSFTGEDVVELHCHGSIAVVSKVLKELSNTTCARMAEAGEFTRRALTNNKLDLAQVEGLADLIDAETEAQRKQALRVFSGRLGAVVEGWRRDLIRAAALLEATIDFADEDVPVDVLPEVSVLLGGLIVELQAEVKGARVAERVRSGFEVAIVGAPNVGKSTLLNALAGRDAAITSEIAGTTRDVVEVRMDLEGLPVTLLDTAGLRETDDEIELIGIERALERAQSADLRVLLIESTDWDGFTPSDGDIVVYAKGDLKGRANSVSGKTGLGLDELIGAITLRLGSLSADIGVATRERHGSAMSVALDRLQVVNALVLRGDYQAELLADDLRSAIRALESMLGRIGVEDLLGEIFSSFCIGK